MSATIQTQINLVHLQAGLAVPAVAQRTTVGSQFASNAIEVTTTAETIPLGDVTTPKQVMIKFISGDPVRVGVVFDGVGGSKYPFRLSNPDEAMLLSLEAEGLLEVSTAETIEDVAGSLNDKYFTLADRNGEVKVVITTDGVTGLTSSGRVVVVTIANNAANIVVAAAIVAAFAADAELAVSAVENLVTFTDRFTGTRTNIAAGDSGFTVATPTITDPGIASPTIHLKSLGTSQVVVAVAPH